MCSEGRTGSVFRRQDWECVQQAGLGVCLEGPVVFKCVKHEFGGRNNDLLSKNFRTFLKVK